MQSHHHLDKGKTMRWLQGGAEGRHYDEGKIEVEQVKLQEQQVQDIQDIANVFSVQYNANVLQVKFTEGKRNLPICWITSHRRISPMARCIPSSRP